MSTTTSAPASASARPVPLTRVHAGRGRRGDRLVTRLLQQLDERAPDQSGASDDNDLHDSPFAGTVKRVAPRSFTSYDRMGERM